MTNIKLQYQSCWECKRKTFEGLAKTVQCKPNAKNAKAVLESFHTLCTLAAPGGIER